MWYVRGMDERIGKDARLAGLLAAALEGTLCETQARELAAVEPKLLTLAWLAAAQRITAFWMAAKSVFRAWWLSCATAAGTRSW